GVPAPSTTRSWPTVKLEAGDASHTIASAISAVVATLPIGTTADMRASREASVSPGNRDNGVSTGPGLAALIRLPCATFAFAAARVQEPIAAFEAASAPGTGSVGWAPMVEATLTITPPPWARM